MNRERGNKRTLLFSTAICVVISLYTFQTSGETLDSAEVTDLYSQAKEMFRKANELSATNPKAAENLYMKSAMRFERIVHEGGIQNGKLYYNIGNVYFRMKDMGRAILNYRRAEQFIPNDSNLQQNLKYARERRVDKVEVRQKTRILKTLFFFHYDLSTQTRVVIFTFSFMLLWVALSIRLLIKKPFTRWFIAAPLFFSILFASSLFVDVSYLQNVKPGVIITNQVIARKGNSETYESSFKEPLHSGTEFILLEERGDWCHIELPDSRRCFVPKASVELVR
ncbi:MAG: hypothetical protein GY864_06285 [Desulfobacterales bacterium]|nr:hypothetical protein [Desulfobacterales bacterium]